MTQSQAQQSKIYRLILKGQIDGDSDVALEDEEPTPLSEHLHFAPLLRLAHAASTRTVLDNFDWWQGREPQWQASLTEHAPWNLIMRVAQNHSTGFLVVENEGQMRIVGFNSGLAICTHANLRHERLLELLVASNLLSAEQVDSLRQHATQHRQSAEWALLDLGIANATGLLQAIEEQAKMRMREFFKWKSGSAKFFEDERASQLENLINEPLWSLLRNTIWEAFRYKEDTLKRVCEPLVGSDHVLKLQRPIGALRYEFNEGENAVLGALEAGLPAADIAAILAQLPEEQSLHGWRALYLLTHLGIAGLDLPEYAQPILASLHSAYRDESINLAAKAPSPFDAPAEGSAEGGLTPEPQAKSGPGKRRMSGSSQLGEYRKQLALEQEGRRLLNAGRYAEAAKKFRKLRDRQDKPSQALAYLAVATLLDNLNLADEAFACASTALANDRESALAHAALARVLAAQGKDKQSERHRKLALDRAQHNDAWFSEVNGLLEVGLGIKHRARNKPRLDQVSLPFVAGAFILVWVGLFVPSIVYKLGEPEYYYDGNDRFFFIRRGVLLLAGLLGMKIALRIPWKKIPDALGFKLDASTLIIGLLWGGVIGAMSPAQRVSGALWMVLALTLFHVIAEEIFFRGFLTGALFKKFEHEQLTAVISAVLFSLYHITYYSFWYETNLNMKLYWCAMVGVFAGLPYAFLYLRSKSILSPLACHLTVNTTMMVLSHMAMTSA